MEAVRDWIVAQAEARKERRWSPEELTEGARQMVEGPDPAKAQILWERAWRLVSTATNLVPKVRRRNIPPSVLEHLRSRRLEREIGVEQMGLLARRLNGEPEVPMGRWDDGSRDSPI